MYKKNKKKCSIIAFFVVVLLSVQIVLPSMVFASSGLQAPEATSFNISFNNDGTANITGYKYKYDPTYTSVTIPSKINGTKITGISEGAFKGSYYLEYINIPDTIREIGKDGFSDCLSLKEITIPGSVSKIGTFAFMSCQSLEKVYILYGVQSIGDGAFADCSSLTTVSISPSTTEMDDKIFDESDSVEVQANPDSVAGKYSGFEDKVSSTEMPADSPSAYKYVVDENTGEVIIEGYIGTNTTPIIPDKINNSDVTEIGEGAFQNKSITQVTLPPSLKTIGSNAFAGTNLTVVVIPSTVTGIGSGAFDDRADITLKGDSSAVDDYLSDSKFIKFVPWGPGRTKFHEVVIESKPALGGTILQGRSKEYKEGTIINIEARPTTPANIGSSDKGTYLFKGWEVKSNVTVEGGEDINSLIAAPNLSKTTITMPSYDITITANYTLLPPEPLVIRNGVVLSYIGNGTTQLVIEPTWDNQTVHTVGSYSQDGNYGITFLDPNMKELNLPYTIKNILPTVFKQSYSLETIVVAKNNINFETEDGVLFNKGKTKLLAYPANKAGSSYKVPDTVKEIGEYAFYNNRNLESIDLSNVEKINDNAFESNSKLTTIKNYNKVSYIGNSAFAYSSKLNEIRIPESVSYLGTYVFYSCYNLQSIIWESNSLIKTIPEYAFARCPIARIILPDGIETVSNFSFAYCNELYSVVISDTITNLASDALYGCNKLKEFLVLDENPNYSSIDGVLFNKDATLLMTYPIAKTQDNASYVVPESVTEIGNGAFGYAKFNNIDISNATVIGSKAFSSSNIKSIDLKNVTQIKQDAFSYCNNLEEVIWPDAAESISMYTFRYCSNLKKVVFPNTLKTISSYAFIGCSNLVDISLPESLETIGYSAFSGCSSISNLTLPSKLNTIGSYAFSGCSSIDEIILPSLLTSIGDYAFSGCNKLQSIKIPSTVTSLGSSMFINCKGLENVIIESGFVPNNAFSGCFNISSLTLSSNVKTIGSYAFSGCSSLEDVSIGADIGTGAFYDCSSLKNVTLLNTVKQIGSTAFSGCNVLNNITIPSSVYSIGLEAFNKCEGLKDISVDESNQNYASVDGVLHDKNITNLICYPQAKEGQNYTTSNTVSKISDYAFESVNNLTEVNFTNNVVNIGHSVFINAAKIGKIIINNKDAEFKTIESYPVKTMFYGISDSLLKNLVVCGYLGSTAEREVFIYATKGIKFKALDDVTKGLVIQKIPKNSSQRTVDNLSLDNNTWLGEVVGYKVPIDALTSESAKKIIVPSLVTNETDGLIIKDEDGNEITLNDSESIIVSSLGRRALWYPGAVSSSEGRPEETFIKTITSITLPQTITDIKTNAFEDCTALNSFVIPPSVKNIHPYAFSNCSALTEITIPENVVMLGEDKLLDETSKTESHTSAFVGCSNLKKINVDPRNKKYASVDGVLMNFDKNKIYEVPNGFIGNVDNATDHYIIPEGIEFIGSSAFVGCELRQIDFPETIKHIGVNAFNGVLTKSNSLVTFKENLKEDLKSGLDIDNGAFEDCTGLVKVILPSEFKRIGDQAFKGCTSLKDFEVTSTSGTYQSIDGILMAYLPQEGNNAETYAIYLYPEGRTQASYIVPASIPVRQIYKGAFQDNQYLESVILSDDVQLIQESAFRNCTNLKDITWSKTIQEIEPFAFANTAFKNISIPATVSKIGQEAFSGCELLSADIYSANADIGLNAFKGYSDDFVIRGLAGSKAEEYAQNNQIPFEVLDSSGVVLYKISVSDSITSGSIIVDKQTAISKEIVNITVTPDEGYRLVDGSLKYNDTVINSDFNYFEMPEKDVIITAEFELIQEDESASSSNILHQGDNPSDEDSENEISIQQEPNSDENEDLSDF